MNTIKSKKENHENRISIISSPWAIFPSTEYILDKLREDLYALSSLDNTHVSYLIEKDLLVLFEEEDLFLYKMSGGLN